MFMCESVIKLDIKALSFLWYLLYRVVEKTLACFQSHIWQKRTCSNSSGILLNHNVLAEIGENGIDISHLNKEMVTVFLKKQKQKTKQKKTPIYTHENQWYESVILPFFFCRLYFCVFFPSHSCIVVILYFPFVSNTVFTIWHQLSAVYEYVKTISVCPIILKKSSEEECHIFFNNPVMCTLLSTDLCYLVL